MMISTQTTWIAVYRIYESAQINVGGSLSIKALMQSWVETCLRQCDLARALDTMTQAGFMQLEMNPDGPHARLLSADFITAKPAENEDVNDGHIADTFRKIEARNDGAVGSVIGNHLIGRRKSDGAPNALWQRSKAA